MTNQPSFTEHRVPRDHGSIYVRDYAGAGPAFVLMHGFPDNLRIYDDLIPYLVGGGRTLSISWASGLLRNPQMPITALNSNLVTSKRLSSTWVSAGWFSFPTTLPELRRL